MGSLPFQSENGLGEKSQFVLNYRAVSGFRCLLVLAKRIPDGYGSGIPDVEEIRAQILLNSCCSNLSLSKFVAMHGCRYVTLPNDSCQFLRR